MHIRRLIYNPFAPYIISVILGLGLATMFRQVCKERNCLKFEAPSLDKINNRIFQYGDKCYKYNLNAQSCDETKKIVEFA